MNAKLGHEMFGVFFPRFFLRMLACLLALGSGCSRQSGKVLDSQSLLPVSGAVVFHAGQSVRTDKTGAFRLKDIDEEKPFLVKACGYRQTNSPANGTTILLEPFQARGIFLSHAGAGSAEVQDHVFGLLTSNDLNTVVVDIKDDRGLLSFDCRTALAGEIGALDDLTIPDPAAFVKKLHATGVYVIGRIVVFKDTPLAKRRPDWAVIDNATGKAWAEKDAGWVDPFREEVWAYNLDLARAAAQTGFDEIQFDYVRFPTSDVKKCTFSRPNTQENRVAAISGFMHRAYRELAPYNVFVSADVFGMTLWGKDDSGVGQVISKLSSATDYFCPMIYPSGFSAGFLGRGKANTAAYPRQIIREALRKGAARLPGQPKRFRPWLQHFPDYAFDKRPYLGPEIALQILGCDDYKTGGWLFWNARNRYDHLAEGLALAKANPKNLVSRPPVQDASALTNTPEFRTFASGSFALSNKVYRLEKLWAMDQAIHEAVRNKRTPGAVLWLEHGGVAYHKAYGNRALLPAEEPMTEDTVFDAASLTKVIATTPAIMRLVERGDVRLDEPVRTYLPAFQGEGRDLVKVSHLLTHTSGLPPSLDPAAPWEDYPEAIELACRQRVRPEPGMAFRYSDVNFLLLGEIVQRVSGKRLDQFVAEEIFRPLQMRDTGFFPGTNYFARVAPTTGPSSNMLRGTVHDPTVRRMGGCGGSAGVFTTATDLARYCRMLLNGGELDGVRLFRPETVQLMTSVQTSESLGIRRGFGWDIDSAYSHPRGAVFPRGSFGHTGFTGTSVWIDPFSKTFWILLSNRIHPDGKGNVQELQRTLGTLAANSLAGFDFASVTGTLPPLSRNH